MCSIYCQGKYEDVKLAYCVCTRPWSESFLSFNHFLFTGGMIIWRHYFHTLCYECNGPKLHNIFAGKLFSIFIREVKGVLLHWPNGNT